MKDFWCRKYKMPDGTVISGAAARERRIADLGGLDSIVRTISQDMGEIGVRRGFDMAMRLGRTAPANDNVVPINRVVRRKRAA